MRTWEVQTRKISTYWFKAYCLHPLNINAFEDVDIEAKLLLSVKVKLELNL
jgi:hypothetical protein